MSHKPIHILAKGRKPFGRQAMWDAMRARREFTAADIAKASRCHVRSVRNFFEPLLLKSIISEIGTVPNPERPDLPRYALKLYRLDKDTGHLAPRLKRDGSPVLQVSDQMWRAMKILPSFDADELALAASTEEVKVAASFANKFCQPLHKAGYLMLVAPATNRSKTRYKLLDSMNTGPYAPKIQRTKLVYDLNLRKIMWHEDIEP